MKYVRYILIAVTLYFFITYSYSYFNMANHIKSGFDFSEATNTKVINDFRSQLTPWIVLQFLLLTGWILYFKKRLSYSLASLSIVLIVYLLWKGLISSGGTAHQKMITFEHGAYNSLLWMSLFYTVAAVMIFMPALQKTDHKNPTL